jgi:hypothetical protein
MLLCARKWPKQLVLAASRANRSAAARKQRRSGAPQLRPFHQRKIIIGLQRPCARLACLPPNRPAGRAFSAIYGCRRNKFQQSLLG